MTALKTALRIIALIIIMSVVGYVLFFVNNRGSQAPTNPLEELTRPQTEQVPIITETIKESASTSPQVLVEYPQFPSLSTAFNASIKKAVTDRLAQFRQEAADNYKARTSTAPADQFISPSDFTFIAKWMGVQVNPQYVSFIIRFDSYTGGANENQELQTFNYDVKKNAPVSLADLFPSAKNLVAQLSAISINRLTAHFKEAAGANAPLDLLKEGASPKAENFQNFTFSDNTLTLYFPKYAVAPGAFGEQQVVIFFSEIN